LGLQGYTVFRQDRGSANNNNAYGDNVNPDSGRCGGGILVAFRSDRISFDRTLAEDLYDNVMNFDINYRFNCQNCNEKQSKKFGFTIVYRPLRPCSNQSIYVILIN